MTEFLFVSKFRFRAPARPPDLRLLHFPFNGWPRRANLSFNTKSCAPAFIEATAVSSSICPENDDERQVQSPFLQQP